MRPAVQPPPWVEAALCVTTRRAEGADVTRFRGTIEAAPEGVGSTRRGLTRSSGTSREGLAMQATRTCRACGSPIPKKPKWSATYYASRLYCDRACRDAYQPDIAADYIITASGCWEWHGHLDQNGYGKAYDRTAPAGERVDWAHRVSYRHHRGPIPEGCELDHTCENTRCVNPDHLDPVTRAEHVRRTMERAGGLDRQRTAAHLRQLGLTYKEIASALGLASQSGAQNRVLAAIKNGLVDPESVPPTPRLTEADRADIRDLCSLGIPQSEVGAWYGVHNSQVSRIASGHTSGHSQDGVA